MTGCLEFPRRLFYFAERRGKMWVVLFESNLWNNLFQIGSDITATGLPEKIIRPILVYIFLVVVLRIFGKRELAQLNPFDLIVLLTLSNTLQNAIIGSDNSVTGGFIGAFTLLLFNYVVVRFLFKHRRLDQIIEGSKIKLIENGKVNRKVLAKELITEAELLAIIHRQGFSKLQEIETCVLDENGTFYVEAKEPRQEDKRYNELIGKIDGLNRQITELKEKLS
jgi:uncharacterized membrane protein YcaP (DUF421 family)